MRVNDRGAGNQHRFPCAEGGGTATRVRHKDHALTPTLPEYSGGNQTASATTGVHSHDHANKRSPKEIVSSFGSPSQLVDAELAQMSPQKSYKRGCQVKNTSPCRNARNIFRHPAPLHTADTSSLAA